MSENWIQSYTCRKIALESFNEEMVCIEDIAHSLALQCRYNGHCKIFYSVAEHCVILTKHALSVGWSATQARNLLMHDAAEAYLCDVPRPFKADLGNYYELEKQLETVIAAKFGLDYPHSAEIKDLDTRILINEKQQIMAPGVYWDMEAFVEPLPDVVIHGWGHEEAESAFLYLFDELSAQAAVE